MGRTLPKPALRPFLREDTPVLAAIVAAAVEQLTGDDYSEAQQQAWASVADDEEQFGKRLASERTLIATLENSPGGFASLKGVDFTLHDKRLIAGMLDELGIDYIEGGYPGANPTDTAFFAEKPKLERASFTAFGMTRRPGRSASNDPGLAALLEAKADAICFVAKSSAYQVRVALETTNEENLASIRDSVKAAKSAGREVLLDCEHFFDGYKENPEFALACA